MRDQDQILSLYQQRKSRLDPLHAAARTVRDAYYADIVLPLPELDRSEKPLVANLIFAAGEQKAMRVSSTMPDLYYPSTKPGTDLRDKEAAHRRFVNLWWWDRDRMKIKLRKRSRHMVYYAGSPVIIRPDFKKKRPSWQIRNPLSALPPDLDTGEMCPEDIIFTYTRSYAWLIEHYGNKILEFGRPEDVGDGIFTMLEYQDTESTVLLVVGEQVRNSAVAGMHPVLNRVQIAVELEREPNRVGRCTAVIAGAIGLDHARGSLDGLIGLYQAMGKLMALEFIGTQRNIWPETWIQDNPNGDGAKIITMADPQQGIVGHVADGTLQVIQPQPSQQGMNLINNLERNMRIEGGMPAELGGESTSNIRTGKRGDQILSSVLDFPLQEMQEILEVSLEEENRVAIAIDKAYFPTSKSVFISASAGEIEYEAAHLFSDDAVDQHFVKYSHAGVDAAQLPVLLGQRIGTGMLSIRSAMEQDPTIEDVQQEFDRMNIENIRAALRSSMDQLAQDPAQAPVIARIAKKVAEQGIQIEDAYLMVHEELQQEQAAQAAQQAQAQPGMPDPNAQPGMADPGAAIAAPGPSQQNLTALLSGLKRSAGAAVAPTPVGAPA